MPVFLAVLLALFGKVPEARATRYVPFSAAGQNTTLGTNRGTTPSSCSVTITNVSSTPQVVTYQIILTVDGATLYNSGAITLTLAAKSAGAETANNCATGSSNTCTIPYGNHGAPYATELAMEFMPRICAPGPGCTGNTSYPGSPVTQQVGCSGYIKVDDSVVGTPGFVTASGQITTYAETSPGVGLGGGGGTSQINTTVPSTTPIVIGEGRAF